MSRGPLNQHNGEIIVCLANAAGIDLLIAEGKLLCHNVCEPVIELCHSLWVLQGSSLPDSGNNMPAQIVLTRKRATRIWRKVRLQQSSHLC